jgi:dienelactone hydrolase
MRRKYRRDTLVFTVQRTVKDLSHLLLFDFKRPARCPRNGVLLRTGIHDGKLGQDADAGSVARAKEIRGELLMIFGTKDPHVPDAGRETIDQALRRSGARYKTILYPAEHAFTRDEGPRFDPEVTDLAFAEMIRLFRSVFRD